ncbi:pentapeptide repeat-containing protein [Spirosoma sp. HMF3257]|uniref:Pentapeptide repeat-containing protein n=1 Tax=Spirosoma telluris TaxID=2183553 RepID=A0A327NKN8_9BACT|nr:pentapeptide repeat-containing protein [Spirosoma telluris]RAI74484.1 pentapeptide repeat-containing protein [Spirosoma telluris]
MDYYKQVFTPLVELPDQWVNQEFEHCTFKKLDLSRIECTNSNFINCRFDDCNLTRVGLGNVKLYDVSFFSCKLAYVDFGQCNAFGFHVNFQECQLDNTAFLNRKLKKAKFVDCSIIEAHFIRCELVGALFKNCNLEFAKFDGNDLTQVDFSSSYNIELNPDENKVKKAKFSLQNLPGLLTKYDLIING